MTALLEEQFEASDIAEVHWSTNTILAVFFAASLISAVFFGLGYSFGRGGTTTPVFETAASNPVHSGSMPQQTRANTTLNNETMPTPGIPLQAAKVRQHVSDQPSALRTVSAGENSRPTVIAARESYRSAPVAAEKHTAMPPPKPSADAAGRYMVQVGAVGDRNDARMLVSQLRKRGFHAGIYSAKHDKFLHVQIGPFRDLQQAQNTRHHVMASGYRAILKRAS